MAWSDSQWGQGLQGAGGGALAGAAVGGPLGAVVGAGLGGLAGYFGGGGGNPYEKQMQGWTTQGPLSRGPAAQGQLSGFRHNQSQLIAMLEAQARGEGPSLAAEQARLSGDRAGRNQQAMAAGAGGPNAALAQFQAAQMGAQLQNEAMQQGMLGRIQEQYNAQNQLGLTIHGARGMDEAMSQYNAGARNARDAQNLEAGMQNRGMQFGARSTLYGNEAGKPGLGETLLGAGAGMYAFHAGQRGNQGGGMQQAPAPGPTPQMWGSPAYFTQPSQPWGSPAGGPGQGYGQPMDPYPGQAPAQTQNPYPMQVPGWWSTNQHFSSF